MSAAIPAHLLIHSATLFDVVKDEYGPTQDKLASELVRVRFEPSTRVIASASGADIQCTARLFVDMVNSYPANVVISVGQAILWDGQRYLVQDVRRLYDEIKLHHLEVDLSDG